MSVHAFAGGLNGLHLRPSQRPSHAIQRCRAGTTESGSPSTSGRAESQTSVRSRRGLNPAQQAAVAAAGVAGAVVGASTVSALFAGPAGAAQSIGERTHHVTLTLPSCIIFVLYRHQTGLPVPKQSRKARVGLPWSGQIQWMSPPIQPTSTFYPSLHYA